MQNLRLQSLQEFIATIGFLKYYIQQSTYNPEMNLIVIDENKNGDAHFYAFITTLLGIEKLQRAY